MQILILVNVAISIAMRKNYAKIVK